MKLWGPYLFIPPQSYSIFHCSLTRSFLKITYNTPYLLLTVYTVLSHLVYIKSNLIVYYYCYYPFIDKETKEQKRIQALVQEHTLQNRLSLAKENDIRPRGMTRNSMVASIKQVSILWMQKNKNMWWLIWINKGCAYSNMDAMQQVFLNPKHNLKKESYDSRKIFVKI